MPGQIFIVQGDTTRLACDAWVVPTDASLTVEGKWLRSTERPSGIDPATIPDRTPDWGDLGIRTMPTPVEDDAPQPWLLNVGGVHGTEPSWYVDGVETYLRAAAERAHRRGPLYKRECPLLALHLVGTGEGGAAAYKGRVLSPLVKRIHEQSKALGVDVVLVARGAAHYSACLDVRNQSEDPWPELEPDLKAEAQSLGEMARTGRLVLFAGAGVSYGAGLPLWSELLELLATDLGLADQISSISRLDSLDQGRYLANRLAAVEDRSEAADGLGALIAKRFRRDRYGLAHAHLASLPIGEVVTTNYDELLELAARTSGDRTGRASFVALPYERLTGQRRWLLKMHGTISEPTDIVLTRDDYLNYAARRGALSGIVQALLITRHMLFIGFSLRDDNFHRIAHDVRQAIRRPGAGGHDHFGTVLLLERDPVLDGLWSEDLRSVAIEAADPSDDDRNSRRRSAARRLEIFLDCLASSAADRTGHLLDPSFADLLDDEEGEAADALRDLRAQAASHPDSHAWRTIDAGLERFGVEPAPEDAPS